MQTQILNVRISTVTILGWCLYSVGTLQSAQYCFRVEFENCPLPTLTLPPNVQQVPFKTLNVTSGERKSPQPLRATGRSASPVKPLARSSFSRPLFRRSIFLFSLPPLSSLSHHHSIAHAPTHLLYISERSGVIERAARK